MKVIRNSFIWVFIFSIAMAFLESAIVVYLRELYYPEGFSFPLKVLPDSIAATELFREAATIIMLLAISILAGKNGPERFAYFLLSFAIWDIFYYVFLKIILGWPASFLTWDILFLLPVSWVGPVIAPIINSLTMILLSLLILYFSSIKRSARIHVMEWGLLIIGSLVIIVSYTKDYVSFMLKGFSLIELFSYSDPEKIISLSTQYVPADFNWTVFITGQVILFVAIALYGYRNVRQHSS